jgi:uncharacterized protein (TIGR02117 family)
MPGPLKRTLLLLLQSLLVLVGLIALYVVAALSLPHIPVPAEERSGDDVTAYILSNGVHTDIVMPVRTNAMDWTRDVSFANTTGQDSSAAWVGFGWGDKGFYLETPTWGDLTARIAFKAMFGLGNSAMHATFHQQLEEGPICKRMTMSHAQYQRLVIYIRNSFAYDEQGRTQAIITHANYGSTDAFYEGVGSYSLFHTCNTWANNALKACGQRACWWTPLDTGILRQYEL